MDQKWGRWVIYIYERFPPLIFGSLAFGIVLSAKGAFGSAVLTFVGIWGFLFTLRLGEDVRNIQKDRIAFPERPFPSGKITLPEAKSLLFLLQLLLFAYALIMWVFFQERAAFSFVILAAWAWAANSRLSHHHIMQRFPLLSALFAPLSVSLCAFFALSVVNPTAFLGNKACAYALTLYGATLTYQQVWTMNPGLHPITAQFIHFYGFRKTFWLAFLGLVISGGAAFSLGISVLLWPVEFVVLIALLVLFSQREQYRAAEMASSVSLIVHAWSGIF